MYAQACDDQMITRLHITKTWTTISKILRTAEPLNKGHIGDNINSLVSSFVERLSSSRRLQMYLNYRKSKYLGPQAVSLVESSNIHCPYLGGSTVYYTQAFGLFFSDIWQLYPIATFPFCGKAKNHFQENHTPLLPCYDSHLIIIFILPPNYTKSYTMINAVMAPLRGDVH